MTAAVGARRAWIAVLVVLAGIVLPVRLASAECRTEVVTDSFGGIVTRIVCTSPGTVGARASLGHWEVRLVDSLGSVVTGLGSCNPGGPFTLPEGTGTGVTYSVYFVSDVDGSRTRVGLTCVVGANAPPPAPPVPLSAEEVMAALQLPSPEVNVNPAAPGITGLACWFWGRRDGPLSPPPIDLGGWSVTATVIPTGWSWDVGEAGGSYIREDPGSLAAPAVSHTYENKGVYTITASETWEGTATVSIDVFGTVFEFTIPVSFELTSSDAYRVAEVRSHLNEG